VITVDIPGRGTLALEHLVLDVNGTIACDGLLLDGVVSAVKALGERLHVVAITADARGTASMLADELGIEVRVIPAGEEGRSKLEYLESLDPDRCMAIGNGANDALMLRAAAVGVAVIGPEGLAGSCLLAADVVTTSVIDALALVAEPRRMSATLRS